MLVEAIVREARDAMKRLRNGGSPGGNVAGLAVLVEEGVGAENIDAETV